MAVSGSSIDLSQFSSAGVYTIINDNTIEPQNFGTQVVKLIAGFSKIGPFNTGVFINRGDTNTAKSLYGETDKTLERNGSFFHHSLEIALASGPVIALNLLKLNNETSGGVPTANADVTDYRSFSLDVTAPNGINHSKLISSFYNKERFWRADKRYLLATREPADNNMLFNIVNLSQTPCSVVIRKSNVTGFDVTAKEWFDNGKVPAFVKDNDYVSDYFIDVYIIDGNFGPDKYEQLSVDPLYGKYFDKNGLISANFDEFIGRTDIGVRTRAIYTGCIIPGFKDKNNISQYIEDIINRDTTRFGVLCAIDRKELDRYETETNTKYVDLIGHRLLTESVTDVDFLSYKKRIIQDFTYTQKTTNTTDAISSTAGITIVNTPKTTTITVTNANANFANVTADLALGSLIYGKRTFAGLAAGVPVASPVLKITKIMKTATQVVFDVTSSLKDAETVNSGIFIIPAQDVTSPETLATGSITVTVAGTAGNILVAKVNKGAGDITIGSYTVQTGDTITDVRDGLLASINAGTLVHGIAVTSVSTDGIGLTAPQDSGATANTWTVTTTGTGTVAATNLDFSGGINAVLGDYTYEITNDRFILDGTNSFYLAEPKTTTYSDWSTGKITDGDKISDGTNTYYLKFTKINAQGGIDIADDYRDLLKIDMYTDSDLLIPISTGGAIAFGYSVDSNGYPVTDLTKVNFTSLIGSLNERFPASIISPKVARVPVAYASKVSAGDYLVGLDSEGVAILTRIVTIKNYGSPTVTHVDVETTNPIKAFVSPSLVTQVERYKPLKSFFDRYDLTYLPGFKLKSTHMPDGTNSRQNEILDVLESTNLFNTLIDPELVDFRYVVDTFGKGLQTQSKRQLSRLAKFRQKCLGILNIPSSQDFLDSTDPRFTDTPTPSDPLPILNVQYILDGANLAENPSFRYTLPEEPDGASFVGFFGPHIVLDDDGDERIVPPAAYVSNNFVDKFSSGNQFKATAGKRRGIITGSNILRLERDFLKPERGLLEQKGINPIKTNKDGSMMIFGNDTAFKKFKSTLNNLHARDTLISIEIGTESILENYNFEYNDDSTRLEIKNLISNYLESLSSGFKAITSYSVIFDKSNNPDSLILENKAIVDIIVTIPGVLRVFINRINLTSPSGVASGGFAAV